MAHPSRADVTNKHIASPNPQRGSIFLYVFIAIALVGALTWMLSRSTEEQSSGTDSVVLEDQITRLFSQAGNLGMAVQQMVMNGQDPLTLYSTLSTLKPGDVGYDTAPYETKIYHPKGGGIRYIAATGSTSDSATIGTNIEINAGAIIKDVGPTDVAIGDILFTAQINGDTACQRINKLISGSTAIPVMADATYTNLFTNGVAVTLNAATCANCVGISRSCVVNTSGTAWGYYQALLPN